jgi:hypothetical protein
MKNILSIDLDVFWNTSETIYINRNKQVDPTLERYLEVLSKVPHDQFQIGMDHHELCFYLDKIDEPYTVSNLDAHHDLYGENHKIWLNPIHIRGKAITIGNFFLQLMREKSLHKLNWIIPYYLDKDNSYDELRKQIGAYYSQKVEIAKLEEFKPLERYDLIFISISPEWIPPFDLTILSTIFEAFNLEKDTIEALIIKIKERWEMGDNNALIERNRFKFENAYK